MVQGPCELSFPQQLTSSSLLADFPGFFGAKDYPSTEDLIRLSLIAPNFLILVKG